jgi:type IV pilus assembly protein PilX
MMLNYYPFNRCQGAVLVVSLLFLIVITVLGIAGLRNTTFEERMASNAQFMERAFQAANSEIEIKMDELRDDMSPLIAALSPSNGAQTLTEAYSEANLVKTITLTHTQEGVAPGYSIGKVIGLYFELDVQANMASVGATSDQTQGIMRVAPKGL